MRNNIGRFYRRVVRVGITDCYAAVGGVFNYKDAGAHAGAGAPVAV